MLIDDYMEKYKLLFSPERGTGKTEKSHPLGATPGESLISDGAVLTCKEQIYLYLQSSSKSPCNVSIL